MTFRIGDAVFGRNGQPAVVIEKNQAEGKLTVDSSQKEINKTHRHGYINGLKLDEREKFISVLDDVVDQKDPKEKMAILQGKINEAKQDPTQHKIVGYLESELYHVMNTYQISPRRYKVHYNG